MSTAWRSRFTAFRRTGDQLETVGVAQGQFAVEDMVANFRKQKVRPPWSAPTVSFPMGKTGMVLCFIDPSTMVFGSSEAVKHALDVRDGLGPSMLTNSPIMDAMNPSNPNRSGAFLTRRVRRRMMRQVLGEAGSVADYDSVRKRLVGSWYTMNFQHGVRFDLTISTGDNFAAATVSSLLNAAVLYRKMSGRMRRNLRSPPRISLRIPDCFRSTSSRPTQTSITCSSRHCFRAWFTRAEPQESRPGPATDPFSFQSFSQFQSPAITPFGIGDPS